MSDNKRRHDDNDYDSFDFFIKVLIAIMTIVIFFTFLYTK